MENMMNSKRILWADLILHHFNMQSGVQQFFEARAFFLLVSTWNINAGKTNS
jgi:hypothetical protein